MPDLRKHPTPQQLTQYSLRKLPVAEFDAVSAHLAACVACRQKVENQPPEPLIGQLRAPTPASKSLAPTILPSPPSKNLPLRQQGKPLPVNDVPAELLASTKFSILGKLGQGGMGAVYKARHNFFNELVAIKVMNADVVSNPDARSRFLREMKAAGKLRHPNIVRALDAEQIGDLLVLVMEFVAGITLDRLVKQRGPLPVDFSCRCILQAALGLQHAHEKGMVHRDIKPANLMVTPKEKEVKVLDFGLVRGPREQMDPNNQTRLQTFMGTPEYVAPEQAIDARSADIRSDVYSLGCTLYFLLAGRPPFQDGTIMGAILAHIQDKVRPLTELRADVPAQLWVVAAKMMAKTPADRYQTPGEAARALQPFGTDAAIAIRSAFPPAPQQPEPIAAPFPAPALAAPAVEAPQALELPGGDAWAGLTAESMGAIVRQAAPPVHDRSNPTIEEQPHRRRSKQKNRLPLLFGGGVGLLLLTGTVVVVLFSRPRQPDKPGQVANDSPEPVLVDSTPLLALRFNDGAPADGLPGGTMSFGLGVLQPPKRLMFDPLGRTNNVCVRIDGMDYLFGQANLIAVRPGELFQRQASVARWITMRSALGNNAGAKCAWEVVGLHDRPCQVQITQTVEIVPGEQSRRMDTCLVQYSLLNTDKIAHAVGLRFLLDTFIGDNDGVPFLIPGREGLCSTRQKYDRADEVPDYIQALEKESLLNPGTVAHLQIKLPGRRLESPSRVLLGGYPDGPLRILGYPLANGWFTPWDVPFVNIRELVDRQAKLREKPLRPPEPDSAVTLYWDIQRLDPGQRREVGFAYGLGQVASAEGEGKLLLSVGGRTELGGTFTLMALRASPLPGEKLTLSLPAGDRFELLSPAEQAVPAVEAGSVRPISTVTWRLKARQIGSSTMVVRSSAGVRQKQRVRIIPRTQGVLD